MEKYNTILRRFLAAIIDGIILYPISLTEALYADKNVSLFAAGTFTVTMIYLFYFIFLHAKYGQTLGKKLTRIQVWDVSESRLISYKKSMLRESPFILINLGAILYVTTFLNNNILKTEEVFYDLSFVANLIWVITELVYAASNKKRRSIHDLIADSVVIKLPA